MADAKTGAKRGAKGATKRVERTTGALRRLSRAASTGAIAVRSVRDAMSSEPVSIGLDADLRELVLLLREHDISGLPVLAADGRVVGVVSLTDLFRRHAESIFEGAPPAPLERLVEGVSQPWEPVGLEDEPGFGEESGVLERETEVFGEPEITVEELMTPEPLVASPGDSLASLAHRMADRGVHRAIVVDPSGGAVGIVTSLDLLRVFPEDGR
jgi:CBS domain-containing protein